MFSRRIIPLTDGAQNSGKKIPGNFFWIRVHFCIRAPLWGVLRGVYGGLIKRGGVFIPLW